MTQNAPVLIDELDRRKEAMAPGDQPSEMAFWEAASKLGLWFVVNRGTQDAPQPAGFEVPGAGRLLGVYSTLERAGAVAGETGQVLGVPMPQALDWLASFADHGVTGIVMDHPGPWIPLPNLSYLKRWLPPAGHVVLTTQPIVAAPAAQAAMDAYVASPSDEAYEQVLRTLAGENLLVVLDPADSSKPTHIVNHRDERVTLAFTDSTRVNLMFGGKAVDVQERSGADVLRLAASDYDVLIVDVQHPAAFAATPEWIREALLTRDA